MIKNFILLLKSIIEKILNIKIYSKLSFNIFQKSFFNSLQYLFLSESNKFKTPGLTCVIFSKDRALQLYTLLETMKLRTDFEGKIIIFYNVSSLKHNISYEELISESKIFSLDINWIKEKKSLGFKKELLKILDTIKTKRIFFLTDDNIFINDFDLNSFKKIDFGNYIFSLRHSKNISYSYMYNKKIKPPNFKTYNDNFCKFKWFESPYEWSDPWSLDGQIYSSNEIKVLSLISSYDRPNSYEQALKSFNFLQRDRFSICCSKSIILNLPLNLVQSEWKNRSGNINIETYLEQWKKNKKLDVSHLYKYNPISTHEECDLQFIDRKR